MAKTPSRFLNPPLYCADFLKKVYIIFSFWGIVFPDNLKLSGNSGYNCLSGKELADSLPDKPKSMEYITDLFDNPLVSE
jgi:hypothetical protein